MGTKTQYRVVNLNSREALSDWTDSLSHAHRLAEECEQHETEPECRVESREIDMIEEVERVKAAYRDAGLMCKACGVVVRCKKCKIEINDDHRLSSYNHADQAIADLENWKS